MFIFLGIVLLIIIIVASSKKKQPSALPEIRFRPASKPYIQPTKINPVAINMVTKHFGGEWLQFLASKGDRVAVSDQRIREMVAIGYSQMKTKALEHLLISFIHITTDNTPGTIGVNVKSDNYVALHEAIYGLIKTNRFNQVSILSTLNFLSETAYACVFQ